MRKDFARPLCQPAVLLDEFLSFFDADEALPFPLVELLNQLFGVVDLLHETQTRKAGNRSIEVTIMLDIPEPLAATE
ncbi:hypothetical protein FJ492_24095 [Mesorhizobium sp. B2-5-4]|uniref:hypothetical protein n=1 Tax=unclassified Mesorhizobium TaxID=325217 RepID=UPI00112C1AE3|nr:MULTISPECIES: hypothetical protein [unclassified Mesorhizobium]TPJ83301.1 hypothetical protein FJ434_20070 [Mesorhizobium sp. B2-5-13]TPK38302.1 hypothetical protein FJ492_24095 [Mesorhizobium sp. B2-5-4]TPK44451.1 hypothetical protein FJ560_23000 [Mesorhizobium sp. B2-5-5]